MMQGQGMPPGDWMQGMQPPAQQVMLPPSGWEILDPLHEVVIKQQMKMLQAATEFIGVEIAEANKYAVLDPSGRRVQFITETTDFCTRQMKRGWCADCIAFSAEVFDTSDPNNQARIMSMNRDFQCTCCCFNRPKMEVHDQKT